MLTRVRVYLEQFMDLSSEGATVASAVLEDGAARAAWLRVVAAAVRRPLTAPSSGSRSEGSGSAGGSSSSPGSRSSSGSGNGGGNGRNQGSMGRGDSTPEATALLAQEACDTTSLLLYLLSRQPPPSAAALDFVWKLLRMQTLQCLARRFAEAAKAAGSLTAQQLELAARYGEVLSSTVNAVTTVSIVPGPDELPLLCLGRQLAEALLDSSVVEHLARLILLLQQRAPTCGVDTTRRMAGLAFGVCQDISALLQDFEEGGDEAACAALRRVLWGRCVRHAVLVHGVAVLCVADGGPTYGLPDAVRQAAFSSCMEDAGQAQPEHPLQLQPALVHALKAVLYENEPLTPVGTRVAVSVLLRFGRLVVASTAQSPSEHPSLHAAFLTARHALCVLPSGGPLPSAAPPETAAALAGGILPCLERLLRRAGEEPSSPESDVVKAMLRCECTWQLWPLLLAYGEQRQAAALVATVGKLLRRVSTGAVSEWASPITDCAGSMLNRALENPAAPEQGQALPEQLARMLMYAVCEWLPALSHIALQLMAAASMTLGSADEPARACNVLAPLLTWLPPLLLRCGGGGGGGAAAGKATAGVAEAAGPASCAAEDLRLLLLEEVRVVPLLGGALRLAQHSTVSSDLRLSLAESCCLVAAMWPEEVRRAVCANATRADDGSSGGTASDGAAAVAPPQPSPPPPPSFSSAWPPELLRALVPHLRKEGAEQRAEGVLALAQLLEAWAAAGSGDGSSSSCCDNPQEAQACGRLMAVMAQMHDTATDRLVANLVPPAEARTLLRTCSYRGCTRLAGDCEAEARLQACGRCGAAWYCCRECQLLHWREGGHKAACANGSRPRSDGPESVVVKAMLRRVRAWQLWSLLLAYGEQRQAAALVATVGKLLRRVGTGAVAEWALPITDYAGSMLAPAAPEQVLALPEQLARMLMYAEACDTTHVLLYLMSGEPPPSAAAPDFVRKLLRMQTLQCLARRFAEAAEAAGSLTAQQLELAASYITLLYSAVSTLTIFSTRSEAEQLPLVCLGRQLPEALLDSSVVEHLARLLLLLLLQQRVPTCGVDTAQCMARLTLAVCHNITALHQYLTDGHEAACAALRQVLSGRCVRHAVLVHGVAALCGADGGPTYGLPDAVRQAVFGGCMEEPGQAHPEHPLQLEPALVHALHAVLYNNEPLTPVGTQVAVSVLLRFGRLVVASAGGECAAQQAGLRSVPLPAQPAGPRVVVPLAELAQCTMSILGPTLNLLGPLLVVGAPEWVAEAGADCWRLAGRYPALAGGILPCLERLLRRAGEESSGPESVVVKAMLRRVRAWQLWSLLLAYGEQRQAAALVATVGKLLRRVGTGAVAEWALPITDYAGSMLAPAAPEQVLALPEQLARMLMYAVCEWLPELSRIAMLLMAAPVALGSRACNVLAPLLTWLPPLLLRCDGGGGGAATSTATAGAADAAGPASCADDDLRLLLLEEVRAVPLLGGALRLAQNSAISFALRLSLAESCCLVAMTWPREGAGRGRLVASLVTPAEARALLRTCSYRGCTRLAGDSEAEARLQVCGRCGAAWYCCRACQLSHWRLGGHKEACADGSRPRSG
ncbi:hypothetical protein TSOC_008516 [Tetrabaena socialis]|uniref:phytol kinase n=1 Tax=Tetrabaena socialis TaxID=47790 RepID=A0A2J7ZY98_9CHLO|nr:hypothetical protein TSOC_008516 [Tetrabaena socialis]|eukprot:PNH05236.1 hypothetical protein TSOC_008516 [Tetrabaena socialis]